MTNVTGKALIFDVDATLVDTAAVIDEIWQVWAERHQQDFEQVLPHVHGRKVMETLTRINSKLATSQHEFEVEKIAIEMFSQSTAISGALELIAKLPKESWAIATSGARKVASTSLTAAGFYLPHIMVCAEDVNEGKPSPEPFALAANKLGFCPSECIAFEDSPAGIRSAKSAGCKTIALLTSHNESEVAEADIIVNSFAELVMNLSQPIESSKQFEFIAV